MFFAMSDGRTEISAPVHHVSVHAIDSADVHISTFQATVVEAFGVLEVHKSAQAHHTYPCNAQLPV